MITLITGTPGAGKTAYAVRELMRFIHDNPSRQVFVMGIPDLKLDHEPCPPVIDWTEERPLPEDPTIIEEFFRFPDGALILVDEAQKIYRPRANSSKVPAIVSALERHRHQGLDFWLITQSPSLIDANVRRLVGRHIHIRNNWSGRKLYEWSEVHDTDSRTDRDSAAKRNYKLPKEAFDLYKSASVHVKNKHRIPFVVYALAVMLVGIAVLSWWSYGNYQHRISQAEAKPTHAPEPDQKHPGEFIPSPTPAMGGASGGSVSDYIPRIATRPETAPLYDQIRQPQAMPVVAGCVSYQDVTGEHTCNCYTQQGTDAFLTPAQCSEWLRKPPFDPWRSPVREEVKKTEFKEPEYSGSATGSDQINIAP